MFGAFDTPDDIECPFEEFHGFRVPALELGLPGETSTPAFGRTPASLNGTERHAGDVTTVTGQVHRRPAHAAADIENHVARFDSCQ